MSCRNCYPNGKCSGNCTYEIPPKANKFEPTYFEFNGKKYLQHKTKLKCFINPILRKIQFFTMKPFVISSKFEKINGEWFFLGYGFQRVRYYKETN